ncbi:VOC family protein [Ruegeria lacuscaerulensis]|uniref:VOC family protein n=1 Tax=Ruegeria lacuscaerulensis TaxID=55218 RepID=UPI00147F0475|nr:VOC family protein [Ruegeria lacuscaerulensis]
MIGYVTIGVSDMERAKKFYTELLSDRGAKVVNDVGRIAFIGTKPGEAMLAVCEPYDGNECSVGNGVMISFAAESEDEIKTLYSKALSLGATDEGAPGVRVPGRFTGAYVRDHDGNKICFYMFA